MKTVIISVIGISSILLTVMIHITVNEESIRNAELEDALAVAMDQTMTEVMEPSGVQEVPSAFSFSSFAP